MCGILGMIGAVPKEHARVAHTILQNIFILNQSRGEHASGFSAIHNNNIGKLITEKRAISSTKFVSRSAKFKALAKDMPNIFIGHTRFSTSGTPTRGRNNHPFNSKVYSMVHNGGIDNWKHLVTTNDIKMRSETDSEVILRLVERKNTFYDGISHAMKIIPRSSRVAVAMLRYVDEPKLFLFRNIRNPIHIMTYPRLHAIFFSSEESHLETALKSIFGNKTKDIINEHEINIEKVPDWKSLEFTLENGTLPILSKELEVNSSAWGHTFSASSSSSSTEEYLPIARGQNGPIEIGPKRKKPITEWNTGELVGSVSSATRAKSKELSRTVRDVSSILQSIRTNPFMSVDEIEHWKKWQNNV